MNFFMISAYGEGLGVLYKIAQESAGNKVRARIKDPGYQKNWKGIIDLTDSYKPLDNNEIVIFDQSGLGPIADHLRKTNPVFGASKWADKLECDREFGLSVMKQAGIKVPDTKNFMDWDLAYDFINEMDEGKKYVFKPSGKALPSHLSYVPSDKDDLLFYMEYVEQSYGHKIDEFVLQEFIEGTIISTEFWCGKNGFILPANHTVEVKKFMNDDLGPATGCSGNLIWGCDDWISETGVGQVKHICVDNGFIGQIDLNAIIDDKNEIYGLEWTPRFGYDAIPTILQLIDGDVGQLFADITSGQLVKFPLKDGFAGGVRFSIPPYPLEPPKNQDVQKVNPNEGIPIRGIDEEDMDNIYFYEIMDNEEGDIVHSQGSGALGVVSDHDLSPIKCFNKVYEILKGLKIPDHQYRTDLQEVLPAMYNDIATLLER